MIVLASAYALSTSQAIAVGTTASTIALTSWPTVPSDYGTSVMFTATVTGIGGMGNPSGSITFSDGGTNLGTATLTAGAGVTSTASITISSLSAGEHTITATYSGDATYSASSSNQVTQIINKAGTVTLLDSWPASSVYGEPVRFDAEVPPPSSVYPTGPVTFYDGGTVMGTAYLDTGPHAYFDTSSLSVGSHTITATYSGDHNYAGSTSSRITQVVSKADTTATVTSSANSCVFGRSVTFSATISTVYPGMGTPTGTVTFLDGGSPIGTGTLTGGVATFTTSALSAGSHTITISYGGDTNFNGCTGSLTGTPQVINPASTVTTLTSSLNPSIYGQSVTFTSTVSAVAPGSGTPTSGTVTFSDGMGWSNTVTLSPYGVPPVTISSLSIGSHTITATYSGDPNFVTSTASPVTQVVKQATSTFLASSLSPSVYGQSVILTATVTGAQGLTPAGDVTFSDNGASLGTSTLNAAGQATFTTSSLSVGSHTIIATYGGDTNDIASTSGSIRQTVDQISTAVTLTSSANPSLHGQSVTFTAAVIGDDGSNPAGTVTFFNGPTVLGTSTLDASGIATLATSSLSAGTNQITATYSGDVNYSASTSDILQQMIAIPWSPTTPVTIGTLYTYGKAIPTPTPTPTVTQTITPTPTLKPVPTPPSVPTSIPTITPAAEQNSGFPWWLLALVAVAIALVGAGYFYIRKG